MNTVNEQRYNDLAGFINLLGKTGLINVKMVATEMAKILNLPAEVINEP